MSDIKIFSEIVELIKNDVSRMREHDGYVDDADLVYLPEREQAEIAVYLGVPIGVRSRHDNYHGSHKGEYSFDLVSSIQSLNYCLGQEHMENRAAIYPYLPDPKRMRGYVERIEKMKLPAYELKAAGGYGLKQLRSLAADIESGTDGKQRLVGDFTGEVNIRQADEALTGIHMSRDTDRESGGYRLQFQGTIRKMGTYMTQVEMLQAADEVRRTAELLGRLEREPIIVTEEDMEQWSKEITAMQVDRAIREASARDPQLDPTMGML